MTAPHGTVGQGPALADEMDLLALADGRLAGDPVRRAAVEARLRRCPEDAARAAAYLAQNEAIRAAYGPALGLPVPERLTRMVEQGPPRRPVRALRAAAAALALLLAGAAGWSVGRLQAPADGEPAFRVVEQAVLADPRRAAAAPQPAVAPAAEPPRPLEGIALERIAVALHPPNLARFGFAPVTLETMAVDGGQVVRIGYAGPEGARLDLFLGPRWRQAAAEPRLVRRDGVAAAYWLDGPFAYGLVGLQDGRLLAAIADHVRETAQAGALGVIPPGRPMPPAATVAQPPLERVEGQVRPVATGIAAPQSAEPVQVQQPASRGLEDERPQRP